MTGINVVTEYVEVAMDLIVLHSINAQGLDLNLLWLHLNYLLPSSCRTSTRTRTSPTEFGTGEPSGDIGVGFI